MIKYQLNLLFNTLTNKEKVYLTGEFFMRSLEMNEIGVKAVIMLSLFLTGICGLSCKLNLLTEWQLQIGCCRGTFWISVTERTKLF